MTHARRFRTVALIGVVLLVLGVTAAGYLRLGPFAPLTSQSTPTSLFFPSFATAEFKDLQAVSADSAWVSATTPDGQALQYATSNGGRSWHELTIPQGVVTHKYGMEMIDKSDGLIQLDRGLLSTVNGGASWDVVPLPPGQTFGLGAHFLDSKRGWYQDLAAYPDQAAQPSSMWWTSNGGALWSVLWQVNTDHPAAGAIPLVGAKFVLAFDGTNGWLTVRQGDAERLLETINGGSSWSSTSLPISDPVGMIDFRFVGDDSAILVARGGSGWWALRSRDGGRTWMDARTLPMSIPPGSGAYDRPALMDSDHWLVADGLVIHATSDGGSKWQDIHPRLPSGIVALHDLWLFRGGKGWATGADASLGYHVLTTSDGGSTWTLSAVPHLGLTS